jgi:O-antigen ligase
MTTLAGLAIAARYDWDGLVQRLAFAFFLMAFVSLLIVIIKPSQGIMAVVYEGAWKGPFPEKNYLGGLMAKGLIVSMCAFAMRPSRGWLWIPAGLLCFFLVLMSTSKTALLISLFGILAFLAMRVFRRFPILRLPVLYLLVASITAFAVLFLTIPDELFGLIGKDATFTGRTDIWEQLIIAIKEKPVLGYGYGTFWQDPLGPSYNLRQTLQWGVPTAHNGWFETWLSSGMVGVIMFSILYIFTLILAFDRIKRGGVEAYWVVLSVLMFAMFSLSESTILQQNDLSWLIFVATSAKLFALERPYWRERPRMPYVFSHREDFMPQAR